MAKNIIVLDENDNFFGLTYPKRVKGLVKRGRAELIDGGTIRLRQTPSADFSINERKANKMTDKLSVREITEKIDGIMAMANALANDKIDAMDAPDPQKLAYKAQLLSLYRDAVTLYKALALGVDGLSAAAADAATRPLDGTTVSKTIALEQMIGKIIGNKGSGAADNSEDTDEQKADEGADEQEADKEADGKTDAEIAEEKTDEKPESKLKAVGDKKHTA